MLIGLTGKGGVGKDTIAHILAESYGMRVMSLAAPLKELLLELAPFIHVDGLPLSACLYHHTLEEVKREHPQAMRAVMRALGGDSDGTAGARKVFGHDFWIGELERRAESDLTDVVIPDISFENEVRWLNRNGGVLFHVTRPGAHEIRVNDGDITRHAQRLVTVANCGTRDDLRYKVVEAMDAAMKYDVRRPAFI